MDNVKYYASKKAQGKPLPSAGEEDDPLQMGPDSQIVHRFQNMGTLKMKIINVFLDDFEYLKRIGIILRYEL